ncbi:hypothetical protein FOCC_FOCC011820 [Frankliniella occidentalis]|nr:hypothetical protein FOCC_FOCC011820 [Frankliniella occidentalis]
MEGCGWTSVMASSGVSSETAANSFLTVQHVKRARTAHQVTAATLFILLQEAHEEERPGTPFEQWIEERCASSDMFLFWATVLNLEVLYLQFVHSIRARDYGNYRKTLKAMMPWFFAMDRQNYARWLSVHIKDLADLQAVAPELHIEFSKGNMFFPKTKRRFSCLGFDQVHEQNNALVKGDGGAVGLTEEPDDLRRWMLAGPEVQRILNEFESSSADRCTDDLHHEQYAGYQAQIQRKVQDLHKAFLEHRNPFLFSGELVAIDSHVVVGETGANTLRVCYERGLRQYTDFITQRLQGNTPVFAPMKKNNFDIFRARKKRVMGVPVSIKALEADIYLFSRLYMSMNRQRLDPHEFFQYENQLFPPCLSKDGGLYPHNKAELVPILERKGATVSGSITAGVLIYDGAAIVHIIRPRLVKTFSEYGKNNIMKHIGEEIRQFSAQRVDLVWDLYFENSMKKIVREERGSGVLRQVLQTSPVPRNWSDFLCNDKNKEQLFKLLAYSAVLNLPEVLVVTNLGETIVVNQQQTGQPSTTLSGLTCTMEEADTRIIMHLKDAVLSGISEAIIRTVDTDVLVLVISFFPSLRTLGLQRVWVHFGTGARKRLIPCHEISAKLGDAQSEALRGFHAFTGCDFTSGFRSKRKQTAWSTWESFEDATEAFKAISQPQIPRDLPESVLRKLEKFVILMFGEPDQSHINEARFILYTAKSVSLQKLPPTSDALGMHTLRAAYIAGQIWGRADQRQPEVPNLEGWGWKSSADGGTMEVQWTNNPMIWKACEQALVSCKCKKGCAGRCSCRDAQGGPVPCTVFCSNCRGDCSNSREKYQSKNQDVDPEHDDPDDPDALEDLGED